ncbi:MAG: VOC family protein [Phycisphaeraceae bacterium]|nr:VOC family protein [Phycisphaeraceae bacterium]MCW5753395.1 VOC family protein [Phycisphaeraceae bacterium]
MPHPVVHFEIGCRDSAKTVEFYTKLFGWSSEAYGPTAMLNTGSNQGIQGHISSLGHPPHNYMTVYAHVDDLDASLKKAESLGGKIMIPPTEVPGMGHFAWITDPEGTVFGMWKPMNA